MADDYRPLVIVYDVNPNSNYAEWAAAEYEHDQAAWDADTPDLRAYMDSADRAKMQAWNKMIDRTPHA